MRDDHRGAATAIPITSGATTSPAEAKLPVAAETSRMMPSESVARGKRARIPAATKLRAPGSRSTCP